MNCRIGCSGFHYKEWKGIFYPLKLPVKKWFEYYSSQFNTLELNTTFYRFPELKSMQSWYERSPEGFCFSVKVPRDITHYKQLKEIKSQLVDFYKTIKDGLKEKTGPILFQFPPRFQYSDENLKRIINELDPSFINVVEFRHKSWWQGEVYTQLANHNIIFCSISYPGLPDKIITDNTTTYLRFHGVPKLYSSSYAQTYLQDIADELQHSNNIKNIYAYFNNTMNVAAIENAKLFFDRLSTATESEL